VTSTNRSGRPSRPWRPWIGCTAETLRRWVRRHERDTGRRERPGTAEQKRVKALERKIRELKFGSQQARHGSYNKALAGTINGLYKAEMIHRRASRKTREAVERATLEWVSWFNHHWLPEPIGYIPRPEAEEN
jgi:putative transposase